MNKEWAVMSHFRTSVSTGQWPHAFSHGRDRSRTVLLTEILNKLLLMKHNGLIGMHKEVASNQIFNQLLLTDQII